MAEQRVLVCGSRSWPESSAWQIRARLNRLDGGTEILHGDAYGADRIAHLHATARGMPVRRFWPDWQHHGNRAGILRNLRMLNAKPDLVIAFWDGESCGTKHTIDEAQRRGIPVEVIQPVVIKRESA